MHAGLNHKYECDIEINLCFSNPCLNGGQCAHQEGGFVCQCPAGFEGLHCQIDVKRDVCRAGLCQSGSTCLNLPLRGEDVDPSDTTANVTRAGGQATPSGPRVPALADGGGFQCTDCPHSPQWSSPLCQLRARSFVPGSYLTFSSLHQRHRFNIRLKFATRQPDGLLLYNGRYNEKHDFIGLELIQGKVYFTYSLGGSEWAQVSVGDKLNDGNWHQVEVAYVNRSATLKLDNCDEALLAVVDRYELGPEFACANRTKLELPARCSDRMQTCFRFMDLTGPLQIGGLPPLPTSFQVLFACSVVQQMFNCFLVGHSNRVHGLHIRSDT